MNRVIPGVWFAALLACGISAFGCPYPSGADVRPRVLLVGGKAELLLSVAQGDPRYKITKVMVEYVITRGGQEVERTTVPAPITDPGAGQWVKDLTFPGPGRYQVVVSATVTSSKDGAPVPKSDTFPPIPVTVVGVKLKELTYSGNTQFRADTGRNVPPEQQQWPPPADTRSVLFATPGKKPTINAMLTISDRLERAKAMTLMGVANDGTKFHKDHFFFPANKTEFVVEKIEGSKTYDDTFDYIESIEWTIEFGGDSQDLGATDNNIYYVPKFAGEFSNMDTVMYVVCRRMDGEQPGDPPALKNIWGEFTGLRIVPADRNPDHTLAYWKDESDGKRRTTPKLLAARSGNCEAWAKFFSDCLRLAGKEGVEIRRFDLTNNDEYLLVKRLRWLTEGYNYGHGEYRFKWRVDWDLKIPGMGIFGQGGDPNNQMFEMHAVVRTDSKYYDPSYGIEESTAANLEDAILDGTEKLFKEVVQDGTTKWVLYLRRNTAETQFLKEGAY